MRFVSLRLVDDPESTLVLHPRLTVVFGLAPDAKQLLSESLMLMLNGQNAAIFSELDVDGERIDIGPGARRMPPPLDVINPIVRAQDLLEPRMSAIGRGGAPSRGKAAPKATPDELAKAKAQRQAAAQSLQALSETVARLENDWRLATAARTSATNAIDRCHAALDVGAAAALDVALSEARELEVSLGAEPGAVRADTIDSAKDRVERLEAHLASVTETLAGLLTAPAHTMEESLDLLGRHLKPGPVASRRAQHLADKWVTLRVQLSEIEARVITADGGISEIGDRLDAARQELHNAEVATQKRTMTTDDIRELEAAHEDLLEIERKANARFGGGKAKGLLEQAMSRQQEVLDRLGFPTWSAFVMGDRMLDAAKDAKRRLERAQTEVDRLEAKWRHVSARLEANTEFAVVLDHIDAVYREALEFVGETDDLETALRDYRYDPGPPNEAIDDATARVVHELEALGLEVDDSTNAVRVWDQAEQWLADNRLMDQHRQLIERDFEHATTELDDALATLARIEAVGTSEDQRLAAGARLATARPAIVAAEARVWSNRALLRDLSTLLVERRDATRLEWRITSDHAAKLALKEISGSMERAAATKVARIEAAMRDDSPIVSSSYRSSGATEESAVLADYIDKRASDPDARSLVGSIPLLLDDCFAGLSAELTSALLFRLERTADRTQIIYLTDERSLADLVAVNFVSSAIVTTGTGFFQPRSAAANP